MGARTEDDALLFEYTDAYSIFDWGRMPDALHRKGQALAVLAADWFQRLEDPGTWREFSKSSAAHSLRKANRYGSAFNELGEELQREGLRTHFLGAIPGAAESAFIHSYREGQVLDAVSASQLPVPVRYLAVRPVSVVKPAQAQVLGKSVPDYSPTRASSLPRLVPLEVVFRFGCPSGSSLLERVARDPGYLEGLGAPKDLNLSESARWDFPLMEPFTKLETTDRVLGLSEALAISGLTAAQLQEVFFKTAWVAALLKWHCANAGGLELADGKLEWGMGADGRCFLVDAIGPDELRILKDGVQLSKEFLRHYYRGSAWYEAVQEAKARAKTQGVADWKKLAAKQPEPLPPGVLDAASELYPALTNALTGRTWFHGISSLDRLVRLIKESQ